MSACKECGSGTGHYDHCPKNPDKKDPEIPACKECGSAPLEGHYSFCPKNDSGTKNKSEEKAAADAAKRAAEARA